MSAIDAAVQALVDALRTEIRAEIAADAARGPAPERLLSVAEAADALGLSRSKVWLMIADGSLRSLTIGRRRLVPSSAIDEVGR